MRQQLIDLNEIQKIDLGIREVEKRREAIPAQLIELESAKKSLEGDIAKLVEQSEALVKEAKGLEGTVHAETLKLRKWDVRLNEIRNQREYLALSREIEASKRANREAEERITEIGKQRTELDQQVDALQDKLGVIGIDWADEKARVEKELEAIDSQITSEKTRRDALYPTIPKALLQKYEFVRGKRLGIGLAPVTDGRCAGCNMRLPPQLFNTLQRVTTIEQCPSCQRIIFWDRILTPPEGDAVHPSEAKPAPTASA